MDNLLRKLFASMLGMWIVKYLWTRFFPIPYEAVEHCKPLPEFVQDPIQIMNVYKQLEARGMTRAAYTHPEVFGCMIVLALNIGILTLYIYPILNKTIGEMSWIYKAALALADRGRVSCTGQKAVFALNFKYRICIFFVPVESKSAAQYNALNPLVYPIQITHNSQPLRRATVANARSFGHCDFMNFFFCFCIHAINVSTMLFESYLGNSHITYSLHVRYSAVHI